MKKNSISASTLMLIGAFVTSTFFLMSCENKNTPQGNVSYFLNGETKIDIKKFKESDFTVKVLIDTSTCYVFEDENKLLIWTDKPEKDSTFSQKKNFIRKGTKEISSFRKEAESKGILDNDAEMQKLFDLTFGASGEPTSRGAGVLYEHYLPGGNILVIPGKFPKMPSGWDNRVSAIAAAATTVLCDYKWFGGSKFWVAYLANTNLYGFNDRTSSVF